MHRRDDSIADADRGDRRATPSSGCGSTRRRSTARARRPSCAALAGPTITADGIGGLEALRIFADVLAPACISVDHPRFLSFVPAAPTEASILFDLVVGRVEHLRRLVAGGRRRGVRRERGAALDRRPRRPARRRRAACSSAAAPPATSSALIAARWRWRQRAGGAPRPHPRPDRGVGAAPTRRSPRRRGRWTPTSSLVPADDARPADRRRAARDRRRARPTTTASGCSPIVATAGTTNAGVIDDLAGVGRRRAPSSARGCTSTAPTAAPRSPRRACAHRFAGIERADSFIVDPHKWLFAPFDSLRPAVPRPARSPARAHTQHAEYLDVLHARATTVDAAWNASRLRPPPVPPGPRPAAVVQPGDPRHRRLPRRRSRRRCAVARDGAELVARRAAPRADHGAGAVGRAVPPRRAGTPADYQAWSDRPAGRASSRSSCRRRGRARPCCAGASSTR